MNTLDAVLHDALAQSERLHDGLTAPPVRSTIARRRVVRRAAMSSAATVGAVSLGAGGYAISTTLTPSDLAAVGSSMSITPSGSTPPKPSNSPSPKPSASRTPSPTPTAAVAADPVALATAQREFCQQLPLIVAWSEAAGTSPSELLNGSIPADPSDLECVLSDPVLSHPWSQQLIHFMSGSSPGIDFTKEKCVDDKGTVTFETNAPTDQPADRSRTGIACLNGVLVIVGESLGSGRDFTLTDAQIKAPAEASVAMADQLLLLGR